MQDPGWRLVFVRFAKQLVMPWRAFRRRSPEELDGLTMLRTIWLALCVSLFLFLFLFVLSYINLNPLGSASFFALFVIAVGLASLPLIYRRTRRPLRLASLEELQKSYLTTFFIGFARAETPALLAFAGVFATGRLWIYLIGLAFAVPGMIMIAPTRINLVRIQRKISASGSTLSLVEALMTPLPRGKRRSAPPTTT